MTVQRQEQLSGCLISQCLGDALGMAVEGYPPAACQQYVNDTLKTGGARGGMIGKESHRLSPLACCGVCIPS